MNRPAHTLKSPRTWLAAGAYVGSACAGLALGYDFGLRAGGVWLAVVASVNGAVFCTILADALVSSLTRVATQRHQRSQG